MEEGRRNDGRTGESARNLLAVIIQSLERLSARAGWLAGRRKTGKEGFCKFEQLPNPHKKPGKPL